MSCVHFNLTELSGFTPTRFSNFGQHVFWEHEPKEPTKPPQYNLRKILINSHDGQALFCTQTDASTLMVALWCAATTIMTGLCIPCCFPSMIYAVFLCDDYHLLFPVVWFLAACHGGRHGQTMPTCDKNYFHPLKLKMQLFYNVKKSFWGSPLAPCSQYLKFFFT